MEEDNDSNINDASMKDNEASQVKDRVKGKVEKGVAAVAGALKGFTDEAKKNDLAGATKQAIQKAGETTRELAGAATKEFKQTKEHLTKGSGLGSGSGSGPSEPMSGSSLGGSASAYGRASSARGSITTGPSYGSDATKKSSPDVPDIRKTDLAKSDDELEE